MEPQSITVATDPPDPGGEGGEGIDKVHISPAAREGTGTRRATGDKGISGGARAGESAQQRAILPRPHE